MLLICFLSLVISAASQIPLTVNFGYDQNGYATKTWKNIIYDRDPAKRTDDRRILTEAYEDWIKLIRQESVNWPDSALQINALFDESLDSIRILIGDHNGNDAFTYKQLYICFDLSELQDNYGDAVKPANRDRINRFFKHEYSHQLQKRWLLKHPQPENNHLQSAILECWSEGIGNYYSLSDGWRCKNGMITEQTKSTLFEMQPVFVAKLIQLINATDQQANDITRDLSNGPFRKKWGALTVALWIELYCQGDQHKLNQLIDMGPKLVIYLARQNLQLDSNHPFWAIENSL
ncbi:MAG: hypothetical protein KDD94_11555 [Calditrichaeota bacterium]|nr:hypothetical protein [Calditrichota bacterium]